MKLKYLRIFVVIFTVFIVAAVLLLGRIKIPLLMAQSNQSILKVEPGIQPAPMLALANAKALAFTTIKLTALGSKDIRVKSMVIENKSLASDGVFSEVGVSGTPIYIGEFALNANHQRTTQKSFVVKAGATLELTIYGNIASDLSAYGGQNVALTLVGIDADARVEGALPITGATHTINSTLTIGTMTLSRGPADPGTSQDLALGTKNTVFTSSRMDVGSQEGITLTSVTWTDYGSLAPSDLQNVKTYITYNGTTTSFDTEIDVDDTNKEWTSSLGDNGIFIPKGGSVEITLKGDVVSGTGHTIEFDLEAGYLEGTGYAYGFTIQNSDTITGFVHTITSGSLMISPANQSQYHGESQLGEIYLDVKGEPMEIAALQLQLVSTGITNLKLWNSAGTLLAGPVAPSLSGLVRWTISSPSPSLLIAPVGKTIYHVTGSSPGNFQPTISVTAKGTITHQDIAATNLSPK